MQKKDRNSIILALILVNILFYYLLISNQINTYHTTVDSIINMENNINKTWRMRDTIESLNIKSLDSRFFPSEKQFSRYIKNIINNNNLTIVQEKFEEKKYSASLTGNYADILKLLNELDTNEKTIYIQRLQIFAGDIVSLKLAIQFLIK